MHRLEDVETALRQARLTRRITSCLARAIAPDIALPGHVAITQLVDKPVYGVHVKMPKSVFTSSAR